ncbi:MAG: hypothetical protein ACRDJ9_32900, partial [Dehalococcoidia bacterium]
MSTGGPEVSSSALDLNKKDPRVRDPAGDCAYHPGADPVEAAAGFRKQAERPARSGTAPMPSRT